MLFSSSEPSFVCKHFKRIVGKCVAFLTQNGKLSVSQVQRKQKNSMSRVEARFQMLFANALLLDSAKMVIREDFPGSE